MVVSIGEGVNPVGGALDWRGRMMADMVAWREDDGRHSGMEGGHRSEKTSTRSKEHSIEEGGRPTVGAELDREGREEED